MIEIASGNLLEADADALVNTVNCAGFMGKGIALQFKLAFPDNFTAYQKACRAGQVRPGRMFIHETRAVVGPRFIINFPTKRHWKGNSKLEDIESGLRALVADVVRLGIQSIAVPPLGCGLGGLNWADVRPRIEAAFAGLPAVSVLLFPPNKAPDAKAMPAGTRKPKMTRARALFIKLMEHYTGMAYRLTLLEVQKLAYFLQESGEVLRLKYVAGTYGPYADNLNKVLQEIEGHFTRGIGDSPVPDRDIELLPGATEAANEFLAVHLDDDSRRRLVQVAALIEGFETPYGMELLSSVHWVARYGEPPAGSMETAVEAVHRWNDRKRHMFPPNHIAVSWRRLTEAGALAVKD